MVGALAVRDVASVEGKGFEELLADGEDGVEAGHGLLKDHGDAASAEALEGRRRGVERVDDGAVDGISEGDGATGDGGTGGEEPEDRKGGEAFARAGFADDGEALAWGDGERDIADGEYLAERDGEGIDAQHGRW